MATKKQAAIKAAPKTAQRQRRATPTARAASSGHCFVISPFSGWFDDYYREVYCPAIIDAKMEPCRADDLYRPSAIVQDIWGYVKKARVLLADLTGKNPNVLYELGLAHALEKPVVMVTQELDDVPFDLRSMRIITYAVADPQWATRLREQISTALEEVISSPSTAIFQPFDRNAEAPKATSRATATTNELRAIERRLNRIEAVTASRPDSREPRIGPREAREMMRGLIATGVPYSAIKRSMISVGVPSNFVDRELERYGGNQEVLELGDSGV